MTMLLVHVFNRGKAAHTGHMHVNYNEVVLFRFNGAQSRFTRIDLVYIHAERVQHHRRNLAVNRHVVRYQHPGRSPSRRVLRHVLLTHLHLAIGDARQG